MRAGAQCGWRAVSGWSLWIVLPLLVFGIAESLVRGTADRVPTWYGAAARLAERGPLDVLFTGSSRIQAAILSDVFADTVARGAEHRLHVLNLGRGNSTGIQHYLGLRNLIRSHPQSLRGVTVFAEAVGGLPFPETWSTPWGMAEQPWMLVDLLQVSDLPAFWRSDGLDAGTKLQVTARVFLRRSALFNRRERVREQWLTELVPALVELRFPRLASLGDLGDDLHGRVYATSIRTDDAAVRAARELAQRIGLAAERSEVSMRDWSGTVPAELVRLVRQVGGQVVFLEPPLSEPFQRAYRTPLRREDVAIFAQQAQDWGACLLETPFAYTDDDLPDLWHLRAELAPAFTRAAAQAWLARCGSAAHVRPRARMVQFRR